MLNQDFLLLVFANVTLRVRHIFVPFIPSFAVYRITESHIIVNHTIYRLIFLLEIWYMYS